MKLFKLVDVRLYYNDEVDMPNNEREYLCAVGKYDENDKECEEWDDLIFYWFESHAELELFKQPTGSIMNHEDFTVLGYEYREESIK